MWTSRGNRVHGPYAPQGSRKLPKWRRRSKSVLQTLICTSAVRYSRSIGEVNSNGVTSSLLRKWTRLPTHACEVRVLTFEVTDNFGSTGVLPCGAYGPMCMHCLCPLPSPDTLCIMLLHCHHSDDIIENIDDDDAAFAVFSLYRCEEMDLSQQRIYSSMRVATFRFR